jgi:tetratricopeptide (TPR) repeat protein
VRTILPVLVIALAVVLAYAGGMRGAFVFDDGRAIVDNPSIRHPGQSLLYSSRPLTNLTFALNYLASGLDPAPYRAVNVAIHLLASLVLYDLVRRTLMLPAAGGWPERRAASVALLSAALWAVHPVQTESVTYIAQRSESLMGLLYLAAVYASLRAAESALPSRWHTLAIVCCAAGMAAKPVMATAPVAVLLFDRFFLAGGFPAAWRARRSLYLGLAATWLIPAALLLPAAHESVTSAGFAGRTSSPLEYLLTEQGVILFYLRLAFWPAGLCVDRDWPVAAQLRDWLPQAGVVLGLLALAWRLGARRNPAGFAVLWFLLLLAPTSGMVPIADYAAEHRLYLPLAAPMILAAAGVDAASVAISGRLRAGERGRGAVMGAIGGVLIGALAAASSARNQDYLSAERLWWSALKVQPSSPRALFGYGTALLQRGKVAEAEPRLAAVLAILGTRDEAAKRNAETVYAMAHNNLGAIRDVQGRLDEAEAHFREALRVSGAYADARRNLGIVQAKKKGTVPESGTVP